MKGKRQSAVVSLARYGWKQSEKAGVTAARAGAANTNQRFRERVSDCHGAGGVRKENESPTAVYVMAANIGPSWCDASAATACINPPISEATFGRSR